MGNLPSSRVLPGRPFLTTGVDFCGPIWTHYKIRGNRPQKSYIAVFCCFVTKAVHLEVVSDLTSEAFLGALKRFIARRGYCKDIYCDNATNFVGASNQLGEIAAILQRKETMEEITNMCSQRQIQFHFIPPRSPHFGGLWESAVKSAKQLLVKTVTSASLTYEELTTVMAEIEAILNSRPLTPVSSDPNDFMALTPGHFLIGEPMTAMQDPETNYLKMSALTRWKLVSHLRQDFWRRWTTEYLTELQKRLKWTKEQPNIELETLVIIKDNNMPPLKWPMGRVVGVTPGADGLIRVVEVKTATGTFKRAIHNLCPLPIEPSDDRDIDKAKNDELNEDKKIGNEQFSNKRKPADRAPGNNKKMKSTAIASTLNVLLLTSLALPSNTLATDAANDQVIFQTFPSQPGIYYEKLGNARMTSHEWKWYVYYDMKDYWGMLNTIRRGIKKLELLAEDALRGEYAKAIITQYRHTTTEFEKMNNLLLTQHGRRPQKRFRRGLINAVGSVAHQLFGILDDNYANEVSRTIKRVQDNEDHLLQLLQNQTSVLEATESLINRTEIERTRQMKEV